MQFDLTQLSVTDCYKLMTGVVVPRPIAWITTCNQDGVINAAPFSFFNAMGTDPPIVVVGIGNHPDRPKDTAANIIASGEFVVNMVPEALAQMMSDSATDYPPHISEVDELTIPVIPSTQVAPPRIDGSTASLECRLDRVIMIEDNRIIFGRVLVIHVDDQAVVDRARCLIDSEKLKLIGRMGGVGGYAFTRQTFSIQRKKYQAQ